MLTSVRLDEKSPAAGALISWRDRLHVFWADHRTKLNLMSSPDGRLFDDSLQLPHRGFSYDNSGSSDSFSSIIVTAPALAASADRLYLTWTSGDSAPNLVVTDTRANFVPTVLGERSYCSPSIAVSENCAPVLAWTGTDRRINMMTVSGNRSSPPLRLEQARSVLAPAICSHRGTLTLAWTGTDSHLNVGFLFPE